MVNSKARRRWGAAIVALAALAQAPAALAGDGGGWLCAWFGVGCGDQTGDTTTDVPPAPLAPAPPPAPPPPPPPPPPELRVPAPPEPPAERPPPPVLRPTPPVRPSLRPEDAPAAADTTAPHAGR